MEQKKNPQAVLDVLNWFDNSSKQRPSSKYMTHGMHNNTTHSGEDLDFYFFNSSVYNNYKLFYLASSIGSSLSRVSSSSPSSTPTDSETQSHVGHVLLQNNHHTIPTSISMQNNHGNHNNLHGHSVHSSEHEEEIAPPIASRPERTKSIVSLIILNKLLQLMLFCLIYFTVHTSN